MGSHISSRAGSHVGDGPLQHDGPQPREGALPKQDEEGTIQLARAKIIYNALSQIDLPYRWGGNDPEDPGLNHDWYRWDGIPGGMDCSGFVLWAWRQAGVYFGEQTADQLYTNLKDTLEPLPGDLAFYGTGQATHVVMILAPEGRLVVGANGGGRPKYHETAADYAKRMADAGARVRVERKGYKYRPDFLGFKTPF